MLSRANCFCTVPKSSNKTAVCHIKFSYEACACCFCTKEELKALFAFLVFRKEKWHEKEGRCLFI